MDRGKSGQRRGNQRGRGDRSRGGQAAGRGQGAPQDAGHQGQLRGDGATGSHQEPAPAPRPAPPPNVTQVAQSFSSLTLQQQVPVPQPQQPANPPVPFSWANRGKAAAPVAAAVTAPVPFLIPAIPKAYPAPPAPPVSSSEPDRQNTPSVEDQSLSSVGRGRGPPASQSSTGPRPAAGDGHGVSSPPVASSQPQPSSLMVAGDASTVDTKIMSRPPDGGYCTKGRIISLRVNHYGINFKKGKVIHCYRVKIAASVNGKAIREPIRAGLKREIMSGFRAQNPGGMLGQERGVEIAFNKADEIFSGAPLKVTGEQEFRFTHLADDARDYECTIMLTKVKEIRADELVKAIKNYSQANSNETNLRVVDTILRQAFLATKRTVEIGRSLYVPESAKDLPRGFSCVEQLLATIRPSGLPEGMAMILNTSAGVFYKHQPLIEYMWDLGGLHPPPDHPDAANYVLTEGDIKFLKDKFNRLKVEQSMTKDGKTFERTKTIFDIGKVGASSQKFNFEQEGKKARQISVFDYYAEVYNIKLRYPKMQCLQVSPDQMKPTYLPIELCKVKKNQTLIDKIAPEVVSEMIKMNAKRPSDRIQNIQYERGQLNRNAVLESFGMMITPDMARVDGHVLDPPIVTQNNKRMTVNTYQGTWQSEQEFLDQPMQLKNWMLVVVNNVRFNLDEFMQDFLQAGKRMNMIVTPPKEVVQSILNDRDRLRNCVERKDIRQLDMVVIVVAGHEPEHVHAQVKRIFDKEIGVRNQYLKVNRGTKQSSIPNVLRKINVKLGGDNHRFARPSFLANKEVMLIGADVTHPSGLGLRTRPSVAAVVGSMDQNFIRFNAEVNAQVNAGGKLQEMIMNLDVMMDRLFALYPNPNGPDVIFYYRDGVSEGQYAQVLAVEFNAIVLAFRKRYRREPKITFLVVTKRHNTRMACANEKDASKSGNVPPGTVADKNLCSVSIFDWFMVSHYGIQGTSRPAHYVVLLDNNHFTADQLQELSYSLSYGYARCTRSVSLPIPVYYAHHVAFRARDYLGQEQFPDLCSDSENRSKAALRDANNLIQLSEEFKRLGMYFL